MSELIEQLRASQASLATDAADEIERLTETLGKMIAERAEDPYTVLSAINVNEHTEKKNGLTYLSWAWAWDVLMSHYPDSEAFINRPVNGFPYWTDGRTAWVDVGVTVRWNGHERTRCEVFPIMDYKNNSIPVEKVTSFNVNTALQRAWTKCIARHGLGFYIYAGEDLPNAEREQAEEKARAKAEADVKPCTKAMEDKIMELYTLDEVKRMFGRLHISNFSELTVAQAQKMIDKRDKSLVGDTTPTF